MLPLWLQISPPTSSRLREHIVGQASAKVRWILHENHRQFTGNGRARKRAFDTWTKPLQTSQLVCVGGGSCARVVTHTLMALGKS